MAYEQRNFDGILGMEGFSETLLRNHFGLYAGYVNNVNKLSDLLSSANPVSPEYAELKRRFGWEFNGMRLHELYFGNLKKGASTVSPGSALAKAIISEFGSIENWEKDFRSVGAMRGIGWAILYYDIPGKRLFNCWINEHDAGHPAGAIPILVMDVFEHAYMTDYGTKRAYYIAAFFKNINWKEAESRFMAVQQANKGLMSRFPKPF
jgi:Fe-Mn family superoxide dismutase